MINTKKKQKDKVVQTQQQEEETTLEFLSSIVPHPNHTLWEVNTKTGNIVEAQYNLTSNYKLNWDWKKGDKITSKRALTVNDDCVYISALNKTNAKKLYDQQRNGSKTNLGLKI